MSPANKTELVRETRLSSSGLFLPVASAIVALVLFFLVFAFFKGWTFNFYASILFGFYSLTNRIWISVVLLGVTQTFIMMPLRAIRVFHSHDIKKFQEKIEEEKTSQDRFTTVKKKFKQGNLTFLFYLVDFMTQLTLFISIGRLFLTDFYSSPINPDSLASFIPYPDYPLQGLMFKLPYPVITQTKTLGMNVVFWAWLGILVLHVLIYTARSVMQRTGAKLPSTESEKPASQTSDAGAAVKYIGGSLVALFIIAFLILRNLPTALELRIFTGDVSVPNRTLNTVTAIMTFLTFFWFGIQDLIRKSKLARQQGVPTRIIDATQKEMLKDSLFSSGLIGMGAYFITNMIPSAFELSIFTLEVISLLSPFTLDKAIRKLKESGQINQPETEELIEEEQAQEIASA